MRKVVVVTFTDDEEDELNELLYFLNHKGRTDMKGSRGKVLDYEDLKINAVYRSVECQGEQVRLTNYEFEILYLLARNPGQVFSKEQIYTRVWKEPYYGAEDNVISLIRRIRKKIEPDPAKPQYILNVWGMTIKTKVMSMIQEKQLKDDHGELFGFGTHMFRHYYGVKLTEMHLDDWTIARLLGHKRLTSVHHYRKMSNQTMADETREVRQMMSDIIYMSLAGWGEEYEQIRQND